MSRRGLLSPGMRFNTVSKKEYKLTTGKREYSVLKCLRDTPVCYMMQAQSTVTLAFPGGLVLNIDQVSCTLVAPSHSEVATVWGSCFVRRRSLFQPLPGDFANDEARLCLVL
jgi:hypothetical protein